MAAMADLPIFNFGSIRDSTVLETVLGRPLDDLAIVDAMLPDHAVVKVAGEEYPALKPEDGAAVVGILVRGLTPADWARIEHYEAREYGLETMTVYDTQGQAHEARVYATTTNALSDEVWDFGAFQGRLAAYLPEVEAWMAEMPVEG